jgi:imidazolonepropionase-like amidohydrolase
LEVASGRLGEIAAGEVRAGRGWLKLIGDWPRRGIGPVTNFDETEMREAVAVAEAAGARVAIHAMAPDTPSLAVAAGVHSIEHGLFLTEEDVSHLGARAGMWVPTLLRAEATLAQLGAESSGGRLFTQGLARLEKMLPLAVEAGVSVLAGTDLVGSPAHVAAEALRLGDYGLTPRQVVEAVSIKGLIATGRDATFGLGTPANAALFPADPVAEPGVLAHPTMVVRLGRVL